MNHNFNQQPQPFGPPQPGFYPELPANQQVPQYGYQPAGYAAPTSGGYAQPPPPGQR